MKLLKIQARRSFGEAQVRRRLHERDIVVLADALQHEEGR
jgi:hypothetical protein